MRCGCGNWLLAPLAHLLMRRDDAARDRERAAERQVALQRHDTVARRFPDPTVTREEFDAIRRAQMSALYLGEGQEAASPVGDGRIARVAYVSEDPERWRGEIITPGVSGAFPDGSASGLLPEIVHKTFYQIPSAPQDVVAEWPVELIPFPNEESDMPKITDPVVALLVRECRKWLKQDSNRSPMDYAMQQHMAEVIRKRNSTFDRRQCAAVLDIVRATPKAITKG